jgi:hypothetical protein
MGNRIMGRYSRARHRSASRPLPRLPLPPFRRAADDSYADAVDKIGAEIRGLRQIPAAPSFDDDPIDALLAVAGLVERGHL